MSTSTFIFIRSISTTCANYGKRNFRKFQIPNKRGSVIFKKTHNSSKNDGVIPIDKRGTRDTGFYNEYEDFIQIPEKIPELIVPSLENFELKPYVSYKLGKTEIEQPEFTPQELFNRIYAPKIISDYENGQLDDEGQSKNPSAIERMTSEEAKAEASKTGCDIYTDGDLRNSWMY